MGMRAVEVMEESRKVRDILYGDGHTCNSIKDCYFDRYISDNNDNNGVLDGVLADGGIKLVIAPTGSGKSTALLERAEALTAADKGYRVIFCLPAKMLTLQMGNRDSVYSMTGGDSFDETRPIIATTYEKMFEVRTYIETHEYPICPIGTETKKNVLVLDESHLLTTQHMFRNTAITGIISCIEQNYFHSVVLVTATPSPMSLFRCNRIVEFQRRNPVPRMDRLEIIAVDDVAGYIRNIDYDNEFPFIRLNNTAEIDSLLAQMPQKMARLTKDDKNTKTYQDIVNDGKIDGTGISGVLSTSVVEAGVNITDFPDNIVPTAAFVDNNISADSIEQFLNRFRKTDSRHVRCARVVVRKHGPRAVKVSLLSCGGDDTVLCEFQDIHMEMGNLSIWDTGLMDTVGDGKYRLRFETGSGIFHRYITIASSGVAGKSRYVRNSAAPIVFDGMGFRPFIEILGGNIKDAGEPECVRQALQEVYRQRRQSLVGLDDDEMDSERFRNDTLIGHLIGGYIREAGELGDCISYNGREVVTDKRSCYEISYHQFNRQYYHNHDILAGELEKRLGIRVELMEQDTAGGRRAPRNEEDIWEDIEDMRQYVADHGDDTFWRSIMGYNNFLSCYSRSRKAMEIREQEYIMEQLYRLEKAGIKGSTALGVMASSKTARKVREYTDCFHLIEYNRFLEQFGDTGIDRLPSYKGKTRRSMRQAAAYYCLRQKGQTCYRLTDSLAKEVITFYGKSYPEDTKNTLTERKVINLLKKMYKPKGEGNIRSELRTVESEIFSLVKADYK